MAAVCVRAGSIAELVGMIPSILGFFPSGSVVLVGMLSSEDRPGSRVGPIALVGLAAGDALASGELWRSAVLPLAREGVTEVHFVAFEEQGTAESAVTAALTGVTAATAGVGVSIGEAVRVREGRLFSVSSSAGLPSEGVLVPSGADLPGLAPLVAAGVAPTASLAELVSAFQAGSAEQDRVSQVELACRDWEAREGALTVAGFVSALGQVLSLDAPVREFPADVLGAAIVGLTYPPVRDAVMAWLVPAMAVGLEEDLAGAKVRAVLVKLTGAQGFAGGSLEDCERMRERLREFVTVCPVERSSLLGGVVGMFLWSLGQGVLARHVWEAALAAGPSGLAVLGLEVLRAGVGPGALLGGRPLR